MPPLPPDVRDDLRALLRAVLMREAEAWLREQAALAPVPEDMGEDEGDRS